jgi:SAM-dependent methyltransferase
MTERDAQDAARAVWTSAPAGTTGAGGHEPGTAEFFVSARERRRSHEMPWLEDLVPFSASRGLDVLEIGCGAGFDAFTFIAYGANYVGIDVTEANIDRTRQHLGRYQMTPDVQVAAAERLPFPNESFDFVFSNGVLHHLADPSVGFREAARVLRPKGQAWFIVYHRNSIFYRVNLFFLRYLLGGGFRRGSFENRVSEIEYTHSTERPIVHTFSRGQLRHDLRDAGFVVEDLWTRKFTHEDLPEPGLLTRLWNRVPQRWLDIVAKQFGWYLVVHARKAA